MAKEDARLTKQEAIDRGFTHLNVQCSDCGTIVHKPLQLLITVGTHQVLADIAKKLKCQRCGARALRDEVYPTGQFEAAGFAGSPFKS